MKPLLINLVAITHLRIGGRTLTPPPNTDRGRADRYIQIFEISAAKAVVAAKQMQPAFDHDTQALTRAGGVTCASFYGPFKAATATAPEPAPTEPAKQEATLTPEPAKGAGTVPDVKPEPAKEPATETRASQRKRRPARETNSK
jgi:hypothetical protein